jgi:hypothetical protein
MTEVFMPGMGTGRRGGFKYVTTPSYEFGSVITRTLPSTKLKPTTRELLRGFCGLIAWTSLNYALDGMSEGKRTNGESEGTGARSDAESVRRIPLRAQNESTDTFNAAKNPSTSDRYDGLTIEDIPPDIAAILDEAEALEKVKTEGLPVSAPLISRVEDAKLRNELASAKASLRSHKVFILFAIIGAIALFLGPVHKFEIYVEPYDSRVFVMESNWWGLESTPFEIRWMKPTGLDDEAWCKKDSRGNWVAFIVEGPL